MEKSNIPDEKFSFSGYDFPMKTFRKYRPYPALPVFPRSWPDKRITRAPVWCSVDLRDGNQALAEPMNPSEKLEFFRLLTAAGFKEIEVGFPSASGTDYDFVRTLITEDFIPQDVTIQVLTQARAHLIEKTISSLSGCPQAIIHLYNSTSELQRRVVFSKNKKEIIKIAVDGAACILNSVKHLSSCKLRFEYSPESYTGTEIDFAVEVCSEVIDTFGSDKANPLILNLPATVEMSTPNIYADSIEYFCRNLKKREAAVISIHNHNDRGSAVAAAELALMAGAERVEGTLYGNGERTGNVDIITLALNMMSQGIDPRLDFSNIDGLSEVYERICKIPVHPRHPYAGSLVFTAFSGSHQDAIRKGLNASRESRSEIWEVPYLPIDPGDIGRTYEALVRINSQSGKGGVAFVLEHEYGYKLPKEMHPEIQKYVQAESERTGNEIKPPQILRIFQEEYLQRCVPFVLKSCDIHGHTYGDTDPNSELSEVESVVVKNGTEITIRGKGNGPVDAFAKSLINDAGAVFSLTSYHEHALTSGTNSSAVAYIQITCATGIFFGVGMDSNISIAPMKALLSALNRSGLQF